MGLHPPHTIDQAELIPAREATKQTIYVGRKERVYGATAYVAVCDLLCRRQLAGASVFLGVDGTVGGQRERAQLFGRNIDVPMMIISAREKAFLLVVEFLVRQEP